jgi:hypothetical protein
MIMKKRYFAGIDPGFSGATVVIDDNLNIVNFFDTPVLVDSNGRKKIYDMRNLVKIVDDISAYYPLICVEMQQAMPFQGVSSTFCTGFGYGLWLGMLACARLRHFSCRPATWHKAILSGQPGKGKMRAISKCEELFPELPLTMIGRKKKLDGRADAALIAYYSYLVKKERKKA